MPITDFSRMKHFKTLLTAIFSAGAIVGCATPNTRLSVYSYRLFDGSGGSNSVGQLELRESPQGATVQIVTPHSNTSQCVAIPNRASVSRDEIYTTIVTEPAFGNCQSVKYQIRNNGTGGTRYAMVNGVWSQDPYDRVLIPR